MTVGLGVFVDICIVVRAGELMAAVEPELAVVATAELVVVVLPAPGVLVAGVNEGVVAVQSGQIVTVLVVKKVE